MAAETLQEELLAVAGVARAEVDGDPDAPRSVKVGLDPGADPEQVGARVQAILAAHGLRSRVGDEPAGPPPPPGAPGSVVALRGLELREGPSSVAAATGGDAPPVPAGSPEVADAEQPAVLQPSGAVDVAPDALASLSVEEGRGGVTITAKRRDGTSVTRRARTAGGGIEEAVVAAVAELRHPDRPPPLLVAVTDLEVSGTPVVVVVLDPGEGERRAGAAVAEGGRAYAVAAAAWAALTNAG